MFIRVTATAATTTTGSDTAPISGSIHDIEVSLPTHTAGDLEYAVLRNSEAIYPTSGFAIRPSSGDDNVSLSNSNVHITEGDIINLIVKNNNTSTDYILTVKLTLAGHEPSVEEGTEPYTRKYDYDMYNR